MSLIPQASSPLPMRSPWKTPSGRMRLFLQSAPTMPCSMRPTGPKASSGCHRSSNKAGCLPALLHLEAQNLRQVAQKHADTVRRFPEHPGVPPVNTGAAVETADKQIVQFIETFPGHAVRHENKVHAV